MNWKFYVVIIILLLYYTKLYKSLFNSVNINDSIYGVYRSEHKILGFYKHFIITQHPVSDDKKILVRYQGKKNPTDDQDKIFNKELEEMKNNALDPQYESEDVTIKNNKISINDKDVKRDGHSIIFDNNTIYKKIQNL